LLDDLNGPTAKRYRSRHAHKIAGDKRDVSGLHGYVGAGADSDAYISLRQRRRIVDTITDHCYLLPFSLQALDLSCLVLRQDFRQYPVDSHFAADGLGSAPIVTSKHDYLKSHLVQGSYCFPRAVLKRVGHTDDCYRLIVNRDVYWCLSLAGKHLRSFSKTVQSQPPISK
jgi:hypothetical protein